MLRINEHMTFILAALVFTAFSLPAQAGVSIRIGTLGYGYGYSSGANYYAMNHNYYGPSSSYFGRSFKYNRHNTYRSNYYKKYSPGTYVYGYYPFDSYKFRYQIRPSSFYNNGSRYNRGYDHAYNKGYSDGQNTRHRHKGARVAVKNRK